MNFRPLHNYTRHLVKKGIQTNRMSTGTKRARLKWLAVFIFGFSMFVMLAVSVVLFHSASFAVRLAQIAGHTLGENQRLAVSLGIGIFAGLLIMVTAYLLFPKKKDVI